MEFVTLLRRDHEKVASLFQQIHNGFHEADTPQRHNLFRELKNELDLHAALEDCTSTESSSRQKPLATMLTTHKKRIAKLKYFWMNLRLPRSMTINGSAGSRICNSWLRRMSLRKKT